MTAFFFELRSCLQCLFNVFTQWCGVLLDFKFQLPHTNSEHEFLLNLQPEDLSRKGALSSFEGLEVSPQISNPMELWAVGETTLQVYNDSTLPTTPHVFFIFCGGFGSRVNRGLQKNGLKPFGSR